MNKKTMKIISVLAIIMCIIMSAVTVFADVTISGMTNQQLDDSATTSLQSVGGQIAAVIRNAGIIVALIVLMILGIKYMTGSAEEKAEYKKTMVPYLVGAVILFGAAAIAQGVISISQGITGGVATPTTTT